MRQVSLNFERKQGEKKVPYSDLKPGEFFTVFPVSGPTSYAQDLYIKLENSFVNVASGGSCGVSPYNDLVYRVGVKITVRAAE